MTSHNSQLTTHNSPATTAYIALGSNLGNRLENISQAIRLLDRTPEITIVKISSLIETTPVGGPKGQNNYINGVAEILSQISAEPLLELMQSVETQLGRPAQQDRPRWSPRTIDLDLLLFGSEIIDKPRLKVPHPLMHQRRFVMAPLVELAPDLTHPLLGLTMREILDSLTPLIAIAGIIGVGKTTLATKLAQLLNARLILEEYDKNPFLPRQIAGDAQAALPSELFFLMSRARQLAPENIDVSELHICDYLFEKNRIFAEIFLNNRCDRKKSEKRRKNNGNASKSSGKSTFDAGVNNHQFAVYDELEHSIRPYITAPRTVIYLTDSVKNCHERIINRGRDFEKTITTDWLTRLSAAYDNLFRNWNSSRLIRIDCSSLDLRRDETINSIAQKLS